MTQENDEELAFQAALLAVSKKYEAKIPGLLDEVSKLRAELQQMASDGFVVDDKFRETFELLLKKSHAMAGSAGQFGHPELTELARAVEEMCLSIMEAEFKNLDAFSLLFQFVKTLEEYKF